jgi:hypothetical protein
MPRKRSARIPKYRLHKPTGLAVVRLNGRDIYLGKHGSDQSHERYEQVIAEWLANQRQLAVRREQRGSTNWISVAELVLAYLEHAEAYYTKNGTPTGEYNNIRDSVRQLSKLYGRTLVVDFGPAQLKAVRQAMIRDDLCRNVINCRVNRIRRIFKWGVGNQLVPPDVLQALQAVDPLKRARVNGGSKVQRLAGEKCSADRFRIEMKGKDVDGAQGVEKPFGGFRGGERSPRKGSGGTCGAGSPREGGLEGGQLGGRARRRLASARR